MDIFNPAINHTFRVPDDATPDEINGIIGSVEQQAQSRAGILGGLGAVGRMVQSLDAPHYPTVDPVAAMAMTPQALNATLQRQAESRQQQEALAQRERESTAQALQQEKDRRVRLQAMQQQMKNDESERKIREQQLGLQKQDIEARVAQTEAETQRQARPKYTIDEQTGIVWKEQDGVLSAEQNQMAAQAAKDMVALRKSDGAGGGGRAKESGMTGPNGEDVYWDQRGGWTYIDAATKMPVRFGAQAPDPLDPDRDKREQAYVDAVKALGRSGVVDAADLQKQARVLSETMFPVPKEKKPLYGKRMAPDDFAAMPKAFQDQFLDNGGDITDDPAQANEGPTAVRMRRQAGATAPVQPVIPAPAGPPPGARRATMNGVSGYVVGQEFYPDDEARANGWIN